MVDTAADAEVVGTMDVISAAVESEANSRTADIKVIVSPSMAGARPSRSSGFAVLYMSGMIYAVETFRAVVQPANVLVEGKSNEGSPRTIWRRPFACHSAACSCCVLVAH